MKVTYGEATFDRGLGMISSGELHMDGVRDGGFIEFFESAGENGWELCGVFPSGTVGSKVATPGTSELRLCKDSSEYITFIFKKV